MGLNERRRQKEIIDTTVPEREAELKEITGKAITYTIEWDGFETIEEMDQLANRIFVEISEGFQRICRDEMGKEAVAEKINTILIRDVESSDWLNTATIEDGTLTFEWNFGGGSYFSGDMIEERVSNFL